MNGARKGPLLAWLGAFLLFVCVAHGNFETVPTVYRGPYEYSLPGADSDFTPQHVPDDGTPPDDAVPGTAAEVTS